MSYDRTGLEFCKVHTDISKLGEQCTKPAWSMTCSRYYLDLEASLADPKVLSVLAELHASQDKFRLLGNYPEN